MAEISDDELKILQNSRALLAKLNGNPEARSLLEASVKKVMPEVETEADIGARLAAPHIEAFKAEVVEPLKKQLEEFQAGQKAQSEAAVEASLNAAFKDMRENRGFTDDGIEAVKRMMVENKIADPHAAAARFAELNPPAPREEQSQFAPASWNFEQNLSDNDVKGLFENPDAWGDKQAAAVLNEIRLGNDS